MSNEQNSSPSEENGGLSRDLGLFSIVMIGLGAMIGAGIFVLIGIAAGRAGPGVILTFVLNGAVALIVGSAYAELGSALPRAGGVYQWAKEIPNPPVSFMAGWVSWFGHAVACSLYALGFGSFATELLSLALGSLPMGRELLSLALAAAVVLVFVCVNLVGSSEVSLAENVVTSLKVSILLVLIGFGMAQVFGEPRPLSDYQPFLPEGFLGVVVAMGLTFIAFEGYEIITQSGEEVQDPARNIPRAIFISIAVAASLYVLVAFVLIGGVTPPGDQPVYVYLGSLEELGLAAAAGELMPYGYVTVLIAGMASTASALNASIYSSSRVAFAIGRDRKLPGLFGRVGSRTETPYGAILASGAIVLVMALSLPIEDVAASANVMFLLLFGSANYAVLALRRAQPEMERPFEMPLLPYLPWVGIAVSVILALTLFTVSLIAWFSALAWLVAGLIIYSTYSRRRGR